MTAPSSGRATPETPPEARGCEACRYYQVAGRIDLPGGLDLQDIVVAHHAALAEAKAEAERLREVIEWLLNDGKLTVPVGATPLISRRIHMKEGCTCPAHVALRTSPLKPTGSGEGGT